MPRQIVVDLGGEVSSFDLSKVSRDKLYGRKRRVVVDQLEQECTTAMLTREGNALVPQGGIANLYVDDTMRVVERSELQAVDAEQRPAPEVSSTLNESQPLEGPVPVERVLDHIVTAVYELDPETLGDDLRAGLERGEIYETQFAYRSGFDRWPAFLVQNDHGVFALIAQEAPFDFIGRELLRSDDSDDDDPFEDDLDFSMM